MWKHEKAAPLPAGPSGGNQSLPAAHNRRRLAVHKQVVHRLVVHKQKLAAPMAAVVLIVPVPEPEVACVVAAHSAGALGVAAPEGRSHLAAVCQSPRAVVGRLPQPGASTPSTAAPEGRPPVPQSVSVACPAPAWVGVGSTLSGRGIIHVHGQCTCT